MYIIIHDELGTLLLVIDNSGVDFANGIAHFTTDEGDDYKVPATDIEYIGTEHP